MKPVVSGAVAAMVTPFDTNGELDVVGIGRLSEWLSSKGVDGLFIGGTTGEGLLMSLDERMLLLETTVSAVQGSVKVITQAGCLNTADTIRLLKHASETGADGAAVISPSFYHYDESALIEHFTLTAASAPDLPVYLYNIPGNTGNPITPNIVKAVIDISPNIVGIKDSSRDMPLLEEFVKLSSDSFDILVGSDRAILPGLSAGAVGVVSATGTVFPESVIEVMSAFESGDMTAAQEARKRLDSLLGLLKTGPVPAGYKTALGKRGFDVGGVRAPLRNLSHEETERFTKLFDELSVPFHKYGDVSRTSVRRSSKARD